MWDCHFILAVSVTPSSHVDFSCSMGLSLMVCSGMPNGDLLKGDCHSHNMVVA